MLVKDEHAETAIGCFAVAAMWTLYAASTAVSFYLVCYLPYKLIMWALGD